MQHSAYIVTCFAVAFLVTANEFAFGQENLAKESTVDLPKTRTIKDLTKQANDELARYGFPQSLSDGDLTISLLTGLQNDTLKWDGQLERFVKTLAATGELTLRVGFEAFAETDEYHFKTEDGKSILLKGPKGIHFVINIFRTPTKSDLGGKEVYKQMSFRIYELKK